MAKCANCVNEAPYLYRVTPTFGIPYCSKHVPKFLLAELKAGNLHVSAVEEESPVATKSKSSKAKNVEPVVEEPIVEEPVVEEPPVVEEAQAE
jgi:hypothetical protein